MTLSTHSPSATYGGETLFLVEGKLGELQVARTTVNLLAQIEKNSQAKNLVSGVIGAVSGMHGMVANAAALTMYDGEDSHNFAAVLGEHIVCGTLEHADQFKNGEPVKAVVSKRGDVLYVHAIMHAETKQFYMPLGVFAGKGAFFKSFVRSAIWSGISVSAIFILISYFLGLYDGKYENIDRKGQFLMTLFFVAAIFFLLLWKYGHTAPSEMPAFTPKRFLKHLVFPRQITLTSPKWVA